jgi:hypothetical protein
MKARAILLVAVLLMTLAPLARGDVIELNLTSGSGGNVTIVDQDANDTDPTVGIVAWNGIVGLWNINTSFGILDPSGEPLGSLHLHSFNATNVGKDWIDVKLTRLGLVAPYQMFKMDIGGEIAVGTMEYQAFRDTSDTPFGTAELIGVIGPLPAPIGGGHVGGAAWGILPPPAATPYSLTQIVTITTEKPTSASFNATLKPVPEPGTGILLGLGILALGTVLRRRFV